MTWHPYGIDESARKVVQQAIQTDPTGVSLNQVFKMRITCAYGLERFWGEFLRLNAGTNATDKYKATIIRDTWRELGCILNGTGIELPSTRSVATGNRDAIRQTLIDIQSLRNQESMEAQVVLAVLTSLCDAIIWWKNRLSPVNLADTAE